MAKRKQKLIRRNASSSGEPESQRADDSDRPDPSSRVQRWATLCRQLANHLLGGLILYVAYYPSDSVSVEFGEALWFCAAAIILWMLVMATEPFLRSGHRCDDDDDDSSGDRKLDTRLASRLLGTGLMLDVLAWNLAIWMVVAALACSPPANLRYATNEAWLWVAAACIFSAGRRLLADRSVRRETLCMLAAVTVGFAVHTLHQNWISLPETRAAFLADPDAVMELAGVSAPEMSSRRMVFANRLLDGGPTATFALANSLAATLMLAVILAAALLSSEQQAGTPNRLVQIGLIVIAVLAVVALFATRSRSAIAACIFGLSLLAAGGTLARWVRAAVGIVTVGGVVVVSVFLFGREEWTATAPSSLEFRLNYWRATLAMWWEHPVMGVGPGGFQPMYLRYRLPQMSESIADPHNFLLETLSAGGLVGLALLVALAVAAIGFSRKRNGTPDGSVAGLGGNVLHGGLAGLALVWLFALASGQLPDFEAALFAVPVAVAAGALMRLSLNALSDSRERNVLIALLAAILIHLCFSGGWTVPGVAIFVWLLAASLTAVAPVHLHPQDHFASLPSLRSTARTFSVVALLCGLGLLATLRFVSIGPVEAARLAQARADSGFRRGLVSQVDTESLAAMSADTWAFESARWRTEFLRGEWVTKPGRESTRNDWQEAADETLRRAGENPVIFRAIGEHWLHFYQRFGDDQALNHAEELLTQALAINPNEVALVAQLALVADESGDHERAKELATKSKRLSRLGGNVVRQLDLQHVLSAEFVGTRAVGSPVLVNAQETLAQRGLLAENASE